MAETKTQKQIAPGISDERVKDLLCCALEGGSNYWYLIKEFNYPTGKDKKTMPLEFRHLDLPFVDGGSLTIVDQEGQVPAKNRLDRMSMAQGLKLMQEKYPRHWADFIRENEDAITGDVFLQLALLGEVVFG